MRRAGCKTGAPAQWREPPIRLALSLLALLLVVACGAPGPIPRQQQHTPSSPMGHIPAPEVYRVVRGDTLFSIAFRYGLDWRAVALWNNIPPPYTIRAGQWVKLQPPPKMRSAIARRDEGSAPAAGRPGRNTAADGPAAADRGGGSTDSGSASASESGSGARTPRPEAGSGQAAAGDSTADASGPRPSGSPASASSPSSSPETSSPEPAREPAREPNIPSASTRNVAGIDWRWPTSGRLERGYSAGDSRKGILITGSAGQPVRAAADGEIVYSGNGLIGYGELIIVKHSDRMLSAYAHNRERLVGEGERVRAGQVIARLGRNERDQEVLHFEIRRDGKPDDPLNYLPPQ